MFRRVAERDDHDVVLADATVGEKVRDLVGAGFQFLPRDRPLVAVLGREHDRDVVVGVLGGQHREPSPVRDLVRYAAASSARLELLETLDALDGERRDRGRANSRRASAVPDLTARFMSNAVAAASL